MSGRGGRSQLAFALALAAALYGAPALAVYQCGDQKDDCPCGGNNPYPCCDNGGNCTWSAWHSACCNWKVALPGWGNANQWAGNARAHAAYDALPYPVTSSVACNASGTYGHVAWVTGIPSGTQVTVTEQNCWGNYGTRSATYSTASFTGGFIVRTGTIQCRPGDTQTQSCGNCGQQTRGCKNDGTWAAWGTCSSQGVCAPGAKDSRACNECGTQERECRTDCSWPAFGACTGTDPAGGLGPCDTGKPGACSAGVLHCSATGTKSCQQEAQPAAEVCDGEDDDCDGQADEGGVCAVDAGTPAAAVDAGSPALGVTGPGPQGGGTMQPVPEPGGEPPAGGPESVLGTCSSSGTGPAALAIAALVALWRRRGSRAR